MTQPKGQSREEKIQGQYVPAERQYPRAELSADNNLFARNKRLENARAFVDMPTQHGYMLHAAPVKETVSFLLEEINRLRQERKVNDDKVNELLQLDKQMKSEIEEVKKVSFELAGEVSQLREERDKLKQAAEEIVNDGIKNVPSHVYKSILRQALGIGVDNETP